MKSSRLSKEKKLPKLIVQIPAYNESATIADVIKSIPRKINGVSSVEVLVADDGSKDNTSQVAESAGADYILKHKYNQGLGKNFRQAIDYALSKGADIIVNIDADGQFNPEDIPKLIAPILDSKADMVTASRFLRPELTKGMPYIKKWGNQRFTNLVSRITGQYFTDTQCGFRAYSREAALKLNLRGRFTYTQEVFIDLVEKGVKIKEIPLQVKYSPKRHSAISSNLRRYGFRTLGIITRATRDTQPLTFFGLPGIFFFLLGFFGAGYSFIFWLTYLVTTPVRQLFNISVYSMFLGIALMFLALLADMLLTLKHNEEEILYRLRKRDLGD